jgi:superkiller protein 3
LIHSLFLVQGDPGAALSEAQKAVFADPASAYLRDNVALLAVQERHYDAALAMLSRVPSAPQDASEVSRLLRLRAVAQCLSGRSSGETGIRAATELAQKAIVLRPADVDNWRALAFVRSHVSAT